jgi:hypothetical protein
MTNITIKGKTYKVDFGFGVFILLSRKWKLDNVQEVFTRLGVFANLSETLRDEEMKIISDVIVACIERGDKHQEIDFDDIDIIEEIVTDPEAFKVIFDGLSNSVKTHLQGNVKSPMMTSGNA